jgi:hypothetical protein
MRGVGRLRSAVVSRLFRDVGGGVEDAAVLAGTARSGTTWLAELICAHASYRLIFEPFNNARVPEYARFQYQQYARPGSPPPALEAFTDRLLRGEIGNRWVDAHVDRLRPTRRLVKAVRGSLLLGWLRHRYPELPILLLVRHPCAIVASFLKLGWSSEPDVDSMLCQPELIDDHLEGRLDVFESATRPHQRHALLWCVSNGVPLRQLAQRGLEPLYYEELVEAPQRALPHVFEALGRPFDPSVYTELRRPSRTARSGSSFGGPREAGAPGWRAELGSARVDDVLEIVDAFGLGNLYDADGRPAGGGAREGSG